MLHTNILSESNVDDLSCCCLPCPFCMVYLIRGVDTWGRNLEFEVRQRSNCCSTAGTILSCLRYRQLGGGLFMPKRGRFGVFLRALVVISPICFFYFSGLFAGNDTSLMSRVRCLAMLQFVFLMIGASFRTACFGVFRRYRSAKKR